MALAIQLRQPSRAQPLPGLSHTLAGTDSCGECFHGNVCPSVCPLRVQQHQPSRS
uniref:Trafficking protein, kinesin binding 1 n=1 Tax=Mus musculus TaxID=10090 RepID=A0A1B0GS60_MOUSE